MTGNALECSKTRCENELALYGILLVEIEEKIIQIVLIELSRALCRLAP